MSFLGHIFLPYQPLILSSPCLLQPATWRGIQGNLHLHWGVSQIPPNQKLALRIVRYDISTHMEAVCEKVGCCDKSIRSHIGLENLQFCVVSLVTLQIGTFEHLATHNTMLQNPYFFCLFCLKSLYVSQLCQQYIVIAYLCNNWVFLQHIFAKPHE